MACLAGVSDWDCRWKDRPTKDGPATHNQPKGPSSRTSVPTTSRIDFRSAGRTQLPSRETSAFSGQCWAGSLSTSKATDHLIEWIDVDGLRLRDHHHRNDHDHSKPGEQHNAADEQVLHSLAHASKGADAPSSDRGGGTTENGRPGEDQCERCHQTSLPPIAGSTTFRPCVSAQPLARRAAACALWR